MGLPLLHVHHSQTVRRRALYALTSSLVNGNAASKQILSDSVSTSLRQALVQLGITLRRSCTNNLHVLASLDARQSLASIGGELALTLCEGHEYEVLNLHFAHDVLASNFLHNLYFLHNLARLLSQLVAQTIDFGIQTINLSLVAQTGNGEVMGAVRILELIDEASIPNPDDPKRRGRYPCGSTQSHRSNPKSQKAPRRTAKPSRRQG